MKKINRAVLNDTSTIQRLLKLFLKISRPVDLKELLKVVAAPMQNHLPQNKTHS